jgi:hypothetical protein
MLNLTKLNIKKYFANDVSLCLVILIGHYMEQLNRLKFIILYSYIIIVKDFVKAK